MRVSNLSEFLTLLFSDINLVFKLIQEKDEAITEVTTDVSNLQKEFKDQFKEKEDVILMLTKENDEAMKKMIELENKIQTLEKKNEKTTNETVGNFEGQIQKIDKKIQKTAIKSSF